MPGNAKAAASTSPCQRQAQQHAKASRSADARRRSGLCGGGFSSLRLPLEPQTLSPYDRIELRARPDDRTYMVTFDDDPASGNRRVSHRAPIEFTASGQWQTISVPFDKLSPAIFGRPIDHLPFRKHLATRMGLLISDAVDGPFRLEIDWIDLCPS